MARTHPVHRVSPLLQVGKVARVNGHLFSEIIDEYPTGPKNEIIALQQHAGTQMGIQSKDPEIKFLPAKP